MSDLSATSSGVFNAFNLPPHVLVAYRAGKTAMENQDYVEAINQYTIALEHENAPEIFMARAYEYRGACHWLLNNFDDAKKDFEASLKACNDKGQIARSRVRLGDVADSTGKFSDAKRLYEEALREATSAGDLIAIGRAHRGLGIVNRRLGNTDQSMNHLTQALAAFRQAGDARAQGQALTSLGISHHARGEYQQAISCHNEALRIFESLNQKWRMVLTLNNIGETHQVLYDVDVAYRYHTQAQELMYEYNAEVLYPNVHCNLGVDLILLGRVDEGLEYLLRALQEARKINKLEQEAIILYHAAYSFVNNGKYDEAEKLVKDLTLLADELDADRFRALAAFARGMLLFARGNAEQAVIELQSATLAAQTAVDRGILWKLHASMSHMVDNPAIAAVHMNIASGFIRQTADPLQDPKLKSTFVNAPPVLAVLTAAGIDPRKV